MHTEVIYQSLCQAHLLSDPRQTHVRQYVENTHVLYQLHVHGAEVIASFVRHLSDIRLTFDCKRDPAKLQLTSPLCTTLVRHLSDMCLTRFAAGQERSGQAAADIPRVHKGRGEDCPQSPCREALASDWLGSDSKGQCSIKNPDPKLRSKASIAFDSHDGKR